MEGALMCRVGEGGSDIRNSVPEAPFELIPMKTKLLSRIALSVLISLVLLLALYTSVQGGLTSKVLKSAPNSAQAHVVSGLQTNLNHDRSTAAEVQSSTMQADKYFQPGGQGHGGCEDEIRTNPNDL